MKNALQHAEGDVEKAAPNPRLVWLNVLPVALSNGPASVSRDGVPAVERRSVNTSPEVSSELLVNDMNGEVVVLVTCAPSPMKRNVKVFVVPLPVWKSVRVDERNGPDKLSDGEVL